MKRRSLLTLLVLLCVMWVSLERIASRADGQTNDKSSILMAVNRARLLSGQPLLALNPALEKAAQSHSDDMADRAFVDHTGSNGSTPVERIIAAGYPAWQQTRVWAENVYAGSHGFTEALDYFLKDETQSRSILSPRYRELGIGVHVATTPAGTQLAYWTLVFGSQPNVLPVFINDGVTVITSPQIALHLTQEEAVPGGEGASVGKVVDVRISSAPTFQGATWQRWEPLIPFGFDSAPGLKSVYVQLRDGGGRLTNSTASVLYDPNATPQVALIGPGSQVTTNLVLEATPASSPVPSRTAVPIHTAQPVPSPNGARKPDVPTTAPSVAKVSTAISTVVHDAPEVPVATVQAREQGKQFGDVLPDWLLPAYLVVQGGVVIAGVYWFLSLKHPGRH